MSLGEITHKISQEKNKETEKTRGGIKKIKNKNTQKEKNQEKKT